MTSNEAMDGALRLLEILFSWPLVLLIVVAILRRDLPTILRDWANRAVKLPGGIELATKDDVRALDQKVHTLFLRSMSPEMYKNLHKLASGNFGPYEVKSGLERELRALRDLGFIAITTESRQIGRLPAEGPNLSDHVAVTTIGQEFVKQREQLMAGEGDTEGKRDVGVARKSCV